MEQCQWRRLSLSCCSVCPGLVEQRAGAGVLGVVHVPGHALCARVRAAARHERCARRVRRDAPAASTPRQSLPGPAPHRLGKGEGEGETDGIGRKDRRGGGGGGATVYLIWDGIGWLVRKWILTSCLPNRITSG